MFKKKLTEEQKIGKMKKISIENINNNIKLVKIKIKLMFCE